MIRRLTCKFRGHWAVDWDLELGFYCRRCKRWIGSRPEGRSSGGRRGLTPRRPTTAQEPNPAAVKGKKRGLG